MNRISTMKKTALLAAIVITLISSTARPAHACSSFGQPQGCYDSDPCITGPSGSCLAVGGNGPACGTFSCVDATGATVSVSCGSCPLSGQTCGATLTEDFPPFQTSFINNVCIASCAMLGENCGAPRAMVKPGQPVTNSVGGPLSYPSCGTCSSGQVCLSNDTCCTLDTCAAHPSVHCGTIPDGCGGTLVCGSCPTPEVCVSNACCTPATCASLGAVCGNFSNGCGGTLNCGSCPGSGETCNAAGQCVCTNPKTCATLGINCGTADDGCGNTLHCGTCTSGQECSTTNQCCTPTTSCAAQGHTCGSVSDGCVEVLCGTCPAGHICLNGNTCVVPNPNAPAMPTGMTVALGAMLAMLGVALMRKGKAVH
jgi:hypothetical protein